MDALFVFWRLPMNVGTCKLCLENKPLLKKSHIIPKSILKTLRDEKGQFIKTTTRDIRKIKHIGDSMYDSDILCRECDNNIIGSLETYASQVISGGKQTRNIRSNTYYNDEIEWTEIYGIDYDKFKLWLLSIIWRSSIADNKISDVSLSTEQNEDIRRRLISGKAGNPHDYPFLILTCIREDDRYSQLITQPTEIRTESGYVGYQFYLTGLLFSIYINNTYYDLPNWIMDGTLDNKGVLRMIHLSVSKMDDFLKRILSY